MSDPIAAVLTALPVPAVVFLVGWLLTMLSMPTLEGRYGERARTACTSISVVLQAGTVVAILVPTWGWAQTLGVLFMVAAVGWLAEFAGAHTDLPFGPYEYTPLLQPQVGHVPVPIPLAWFMMLPPAWVVGAQIAGRTSGLSFILASALAFTAWDLYLDPQMVAWGLWTWDGDAPRPRYFGIPWTNYVGWSVVAALITWLAGLLGTDLSAAPPSLVLVYGLTIVLEAVGLPAFWSLPGPAIAGTLGMGTCLLWALL